MKKKLSALDLVPTTREWALRNAAIAVSDRVRQFVNGELPVDELSCEEYAVATSSDGQHALINLLREEGDAFLQDANTLLLPDFFYCRSWAEEVDNTRE